MFSLVSVQSAIYQEKATCQIKTDISNKKQRLSYSISTVQGLAVQPLLRYFSFHEIQIISIPSHSVYATIYLTLKPN